MRAMAIDQHGGPEELKMRDLPDPQPGADDLLVQVHATSVNPVDTKIRISGLGMPREFPLVLGYDVSGVVLAVGGSVKHFKAGDEIYASPSLIRPGANAELVCVDARTAALKPRTISHELAAALPLVTITAWEALHDRAHLHPNETVLIHAGAGGVGHIAIQLAKLRGCRVITTAGRDETIDLCRRLGADLVINYKQEDFVSRIAKETGGEGCPVVFDTVGGETFTKSLDCVAVDGRMITIVMDHYPNITEKLFRKNATVHFEFMGVPNIFNRRQVSHGQLLHTVAEMVDAGKLAPHVSRVASLEDLPDLHRQQESGHTIGKQVVKVR